MGAAVQTLLSGLLVRLAVPSSIPNSNRVPANALNLDTVCYKQKTDFKVVFCP